MRRKFPSQVTLDPDEVERINRVRVAHYLSKFPAEVDEMPIWDLNDILQIMWADEQT